MRDPCHFLRKTVAGNRVRAYREHVLSRVALQQNRFRTPGLAVDPRGVVLSDNGLLLFASLERAVSFLRAYSHASSLDELVPSMRILQLSTRLKTRELAITFAADSTARMDRMAGVARLAQGMVFVGTQTHFVKYRDAGSPLGYDVSETLSVAGDLALYHDAFEQAYKIERTLSLKDILLTLSPESRPTPVATAHPLLHVTAEAGLGPAVLRYLARAKAVGTVSYVEWPSQSSFDDAPRRVFLFTLTQPAPRFVALFKSLPGVRVFVPYAPNLAVEIDRRHPISLESCRTVFDEDSLVLFRRDGVDTVSPFTRGAPIETIVRADVLEESASTLSAGAVGAELPSFTVPIRVRPSSEPISTPTAIVVPHEQRAWLLKLLYLLPAESLRSIRMAISNESTFVTSERGVEALPVGTHFHEIAANVFVPSGWAVEPPLEKSVLLSLLALPSGTRGFFDPTTSKLVLVREDAFADVNRLTISTIEHLLAETETTPQSTQAPSAIVYGARTSLPLWGVVGKDDPEGGAT